MTYIDVYKKAVAILETTSATEAQNDARLLLEYVCGTDRSTMYIHGDREVTAEEESRYFDYIERRAKREPVQYIIGKTCFMGLDFNVDPSTLIPRFDTECLVEEVMKELHSGMHILDMCTGTGCILLSLLKYSNDCTGDGVDINENAISLAKKNAEDLSIEASFFVSDMFDEVKGKYDIIVSNPPYINSDVIDTLDEEVKNHEPVAALDGGVDGMSFYRIIARDSKEHLVRGGMLFLEIGHDQREKIMNLLENEGYKNIEIFNDLAGNTRVAKAYFY